MRGSEIVQQLMAYAGEKTEGLELVNVSSIVQEMLGLLKVSISKHAALETNLGNELPAVRANAAQLRQIIMNLITNASEAIGNRDGVIRVMTKRVSVGPDALIAKDARDGDYLQLAVADTGSGMSSETQARVFDPFFTSKSAGRGLGLWVVHGLVKSLGGSIHIASELGKGTTVQILLPCAVGMGDALIEPVLEAGESISSAQRFRVLVVEDEDALREAVVKILHREGFEVWNASNGSAAIDLLRAKGDEIDLILLDMTLPGASAQEVVKEAGKVRPDVKIILTSAYSQEMVRDRISAPQISAFVRKPFRLGDVVKMLQDAAVS
jgi:CheY-like chemotaxis protein